jgi:hypothetical protein
MLSSIVTFNWGEQTGKVTYGLTQRVLARMRQSAAKQKETQGE